MAKLKSDKSYNVQSHLMSKNKFRIELPTAGENFQNFRFYFEFAALFQQSDKKNWRGRVTPAPWNYGLAAWAWLILYLLGTYYQDTISCRKQRYQTVINNEHVSSDTNSSAQFICILK